MRRRYLPGLEPLEKREVPSGNPVAGLPPALKAIPYLQPNARPHGLRSERPRNARGHRLPLDAGIEVTRNIAFPTVGGRNESLDLYRPSGQPPPGGWPVIVAIHGGGWYHFSKGQYGRRVASAFVARGFAVVAPNYLLSRNVSPTWPINLEDVQAAVRWTRSHGSSLGFNTDRIVAMGESAGGHLAEMLGTGSSATPSAGVSDRVSAVVAFSGPADLTTLFQRSPDAGARALRFLGGRPDAIPDIYNAASPARQVTSSAPPMLLVHGSADPLVPVSQSREMNAALVAAGVPNRLIVIPGGTHGLNFPIRYSNLIPQILAFLEEAWNHKA